MLLLSEVNNLWHREIPPCLTEMGHQVVMAQNIGLDESWYRSEASCWSYKHRGALSERLYQNVRRAHSTHGVDLFFAYIFNFQFDPRVFRQIESLGIPTVLFYCDNLHYEDIAQELAPYFTLTWVPEKDAVPLYARLKRKFIYLPLGVNPRFNRPMPVPEVRPVVSITSKTPYRRWLLGNLLAQGLPLEVYGNFWRGSQSYYEFDNPTPRPTYPRLSFSERLGNTVQKRQRALRALMRYGRRARRQDQIYQSLGAEYESLFENPAWGYPLSPEQMICFFSASKVSLGINHYLDPGRTDLYGLTFSKMRDLEAPMSGACYLTQYTAELDDFFPEPGIIETYRTLDELEAKARELLHNETKRRAMRQRAREFCVRHHTWAHRFARLFEALGLKA